jgi:uncharacterized membrane protein
MANQITPHKSLGGLDANVMALLAYLAAGILSFIPGIRYVAWLAPLVLFFMEKDSRFTKFHAMQAFTLGLLDMVLVLVLTLISSAAAASAVTSTAAAFYTGSTAGLEAALGTTVIFSVLIGIISIVFGIFAIIAMVKAYKYDEYEIPLLGKLTRTLMSKF